MCIRIFKCIVEAPERLLSILYRNMNVIKFACVKKIYNQI
jgi:hypothetical protein